MSVEPAQTSPTPQATISTEKIAISGQERLGTITLEDKKTKVTRTIYDASAAEVFLKNFLAGVGHGLGGVFVYLLFVLFMVFLAVRFVWPVIEPYVKLYQSSMESLQNIQKMVPGGFGSIEPGASPKTGWNLEVLPDVDKNQLQDMINQRLQQSTPPTPAE